MGNAGEPRYNPLFGQFVGEGQADERTLSGMVAYCLYKIAKREWAVEFFQRNGRRPTEVELDEYTRTWTATRISGTQKEADAVLLAFAASVIDENTPSIREDALRGTFLTSVINSILAAFLYTLILIGIVILLRFSGVDLLSVYQAIEPH
ncbi:hypothetical protein [Mangrovicella endophytica]|uniref:hypothetical protein n=1 Tax=Mangrovicella endophytica TaxID=2066697 RepID=UPI000C9E99B0|nr:hypothetical protein [Mangrovicella endophytica]